MTRTCLASKQSGAVAIMTAFAMLLLIGILGLVIDLGFLYTRKTELQNAADAAALAGAKELIGTSAGVTAAANRAIALAAANGLNFDADPITITSAELEFGPTQDGPWSDLATALAAPGDKTFIKVDTSAILQGSHPTWFMNVVSTFAGTTQFASTRTFGLAVAGRYTIDITPIAICRLPDPGTVNELGYERGVSYRVSDANPIGPGTMYWIDPESNTPGSCSVTSANATRPYICAGKVSYTPVVGETVNTNTGVTDSQVEALNSRFGEYPSQAKCDPATAPSDRNVKPYPYDAAGSGSPRDWMTTNPIRQSILFDDIYGGGIWRPIPYALRSIADYGVLWSAYRPVDATVSQWASLYGEAAATYPPPLDTYPGSSPYAQTSTSSNPEYFQDPPVAYRPGVPGRRVLNMIIVDCTTAGGVCRPATVLGIGKFFMQLQAHEPKEIYVEFGGLWPTPFPPADIRLYH